MRLEFYHNTHGPGLFGPISWRIRLAIKIREIQKLHSLQVYDYLMCQAEDYDH